MVNLENTIKSAHNKLVGAIPQVAADFIHYYGEERVDIKFSTSYDGSLNLYTFDQYKDYILNQFNWTTALERVTQLNTINKFTLAKLSGLIINDKLNITEKTFQEYTESEQNKLLDVILQILSIEDILTIRLRGYITIYFPEVKITNENELSTTIYDMYARVLLNTDGTIVQSPEFCKATYTKAQWNKNYIHSHIRTLNKSEAYLWRDSCLGGGPLRTTIPSLMVDSNLELWPLFCLELDRYLQVESLKGGPYIRIEQLSNNTVTRKVKTLLNTYSNRRYSSVYSTEEKELIKGFISYIIRNKVLPIVYTVKGYDIGLSPIDTIIKLTQAFTDYYNKEYTKQFPEGISIQKLFDSNVLAHVTIENDLIKYRGLVESSVSVLPNSFLFYFKGQPVKLKIKEEDVLRDETPILLSDLVVSSIIYHILNTINHASIYKQLSQERGINCPIGFTL